MSNGTDVKKALQLKLNQLAPVRSTNTNLSLDKLSKSLAKKSQGDSSPMRVYLVLDVTDSTSHYVDKVKESAEYIGKQILDSDQGIELCLMSVADHVKDLSEYIPNVWLDCGQIFEPTTNVDTLRKQMGDLLSCGIIYSENTDKANRFLSGDDMDEAYECMAAELIGRIGGERRANPSKKHIVIFFGDSKPHEKKGDYFQHEGEWTRHTNSCPYGRGPEQIPLLVGMADKTYFVDGSYMPAFKMFTYDLVKGLSKAEYVKFDEAKDVLPEAIVGMVKKEMGKTHYENFLKQLSEPKANKIAGILGK